MAPSSPKAIRYTLTYTAAENGSIDGAAVQAVNHGEGGSAITAIPAPGYHFAGWSDGATAASRTDGPVTADLMVTANFAVNRYAVTYTAGDHGQIEGSASQTVSHGSDGEAVTAFAAPGYHFEKWSDGSTANPRTDKKVTGDLSLQARFAINRYTLVYTAGEHGAIAGAGSQTVNHGGNGSAVTAMPAAGYHFEKWSDGSTANPRTDAEVTADLTVEAAFAINRYTLKYVAGKHGSIGGTSPQTVAHGEDGSQVSAVPDQGYHFVQWSDGVTSASRTERNVTSDLTARAAFAVNTFPIGGRVSGLAEGNEVVLQNNGGDNLTVAANGRFTFGAELPDGSSYAATVLSHPTSPNQTCTVTKGSGTLSGANVTDISVDCVLNTYAIGGTVVGLPDGGHVVLQNNKGNDLTVKANGSYTFTKGLDDGRSYEVTIHSQRLKPKWFCRVENAAGKLVGSNVTHVDVSCFPEAELEATAGNGKVDLRWNGHDFPGATFGLCRAKEDFSPHGFDKCAEVRAGVFSLPVNTPLTVSKLTNYIPYWFQLEVRHAGGRRTHSKLVSAIPVGGLNDTGIDWCADSDTNRSKGGTRTEKTVACEAYSNSHPGQDAHYGRDAAARARKLGKTGSGSAGFDFTRVCMNGQIAGVGMCPPNPALGSGANNWACTLDNVTGLIWEVKTTSGLRSQDHTYTWYSPDNSTNGGKPGQQKGGACTGSGCDTHEYVKAVNETGLCGASDWRLPTRKELLSLVDNSRFSPAIDATFFPNSPPSYFWSSSPYADQPGSAWLVDFKYGESSAVGKNQGSHVRLVRTGGE